MTALVPIGEFARLSHLSVKTLRYYHEVGLLDPATIDDRSGYRRYSTAQVESAHLIRRLRDLDMPVAEVRAVVTAADDETRNAALRAHLERMESELVRTQQVVASLRSLLGPARSLAVEYRTIDPLWVFAERGWTGHADVGQWCGEVFPQLYGAVEAAGVEPVGPGGATYSNDFFELDEGETVAFVPVPAGTVGAVALAGGRFAVTVHAGPFEEFDRTYGALGSYVAENDTAATDPIREIYVVGPNHTTDPHAWRTDLCWPLAAH
ncbi:MerR family transcriptional regulator [Antrihabitans sp. YC2-6]|uniref:MerR family transcriptional regulator n=1 Tax=Antrihabitans sp. YC2-6 TaxID=2799498 RepID=UPI0018F50ACF|nr:MerR family transcriptional regulator [Antrihabitans sp. YC2-6]MBJ8346108.1 MerR family transcriptional regulator [Antrihabitans sp. YC2-6]